MRASVLSGCLIIPAGTLGCLYYTWIFLMLSAGSTQQWAEAPPYFLAAAACFAVGLGGAVLVWRGSRSAPKAPPSAE